jgi:hypothetical protein
LLFEVIERLFSGEPGTAFFNWLMNGGTVACTLNLVNPRPRLIMGKGDDISVSPAPPRLKLAVNMVKETAVKIKLETFNYLDFANRIWTSSGKSFPDPVRLLATTPCELASGTTRKTNGRLTPTRISSRRDSMRMFAAP